MKRKLMKDTKTLQLKMYLALIVNERIDEKIK